MQSVERFVLLISLFLGPGLLAQAQGTYTQIDYPGAAGTYCWGIDSAGDVSGSYQDTLGIWHGFLLAGGAYTVIDYPGALGTYLTGLNDLGEIVGYAGLGFSYDAQAGAFTTINYSGADDVQPVAVNNAGTVAGIFGYYVQRLNKTLYAGFTLSGSNYSQIAAPGAEDTYPYGISASGEVVGIAVSQAGDVVTGSFNRGKYSRITIPNAPEAELQGINSTRMAVVGFYVPSEGTIAGFLYEQGSLQPLQFPGSRQTYAQNVNNAGEVAGTFYDSNDVEHGFIWTAPTGSAEK